VIGDGHGNAIHLGETRLLHSTLIKKNIRRSTCARHTPEQREAIGRTLRTSCRDMSYRGAGTLNSYMKKRILFIEMNTRVKLTTCYRNDYGCRYCERQLRIADGQKTFFFAIDIRSKTCHRMSN